MSGDAVSWFDKARRWWPGPGRRALPAAVLLLALAVLDVTVPLELARPEAVVVLDVTQSMDVADVPLDGRTVSRLALARAALHDALGRLPCGSRIGLGLFTEHRSVLLLTPLEVCEHLRELREALARIDGRMAWSGNSEVAKGLNSALRLARALPEQPALVFVTDGHEAPPLNPRYRPPLDTESGREAGWLLGVGGLQLSPIPRSDPQGRPLGFWNASEVLQVEPFSRGRGGSVEGERMVEEAGPAPPDLGATPGREHLSALREPYLRRLSQEAGLRYARLQSASQLLSLLQDPAHARRQRERVSLRPWLALAALALLVARHLGPFRRPAGRHGRSR
ncbi:vWA domain-containing protein [Azohydromonas caseinilytica]|uniref:VWA domain-containing protein n=1 Tax=Azohydromonas caseinilytica TaxID=2728836 RepID=A0A848FDF9_9BURK|nr:vWA domain-containing protein [Azohydromonas caseinilytica]NML17408.1 VWA domain-containing protein [Azohydromonas caseinilytica]